MLIAKVKEEVEHTNILFVNENFMTFSDYDEYKTAVLVFKVKYQLLPTCVLRFCHFIYDNYCNITRMRGNLKHIYVRTILKFMCIYA